MIAEFIAPTCQEELGFVYRDNHILVVEKPSGLLSVPGKNPLNKDSVLERLKAMYPAAKLVHRLDFGTSGVMLAALTEQAVTHLNKQFQSRRVRKAYIALVAGHLEADSGEIDLPIARGDFPLQKICESGGKRAISRYEVLSRETTGAGFPVSRLRFTPLTGRTHQLRLHSLAISHPIVGCDLYHKMVQFAGRKIDSQQLASRLLLHANHLRFQHPSSNELLSLECASPF